VSKLRQLGSFFAVVISLEGGSGAGLSAGGELGAGTTRVGVD
jgi:hypothetical protein